MRNGVVGVDPEVKTFCESYFGRMLSEPYTVIAVGVAYVIHARRPNF
jgi:hypothetical protein